MIHFFNHLTPGQWFILLIYPLLFSLAIICSIWIGIVGPRKFDRQVKDLFTPNTILMLRKLEK